MSGLRQFVLIQEKNYKKKNKIKKTYSFQHIYQQNVSNSLTAIVTDYAIRAQLFKASLA